MKREAVIEIKGKEKGPTSMILVGVHGNEICGVKAMGKILPSLKINRGRVLIAYGNPKAIEKNVRFTEANLNRMFKERKLISQKDRESYEYKRAQFLKKYLDQADVLLDIHASCTPRSKKFIICEKNAYEIVKNLPVQTIVSGFDNIEPGGTDYYMNGQSKVGICIECGYLGSKTSIDIAEKSILAFLYAQGHVDGRLKSYKQSYIEMNTLYLTKSNNFQLKKRLKDFEKIKTGQIIGIDGNRKIKSQRNGIVLFARSNITKTGEEAFLIGSYKK